MPSAESTLREWYDGAFRLLYHQDASAATLREYRCTLNQWERHTSDPPLAEIDQMRLAEFAAALRCSATTTGKHLRHINHLLNKAGPAGPHNRDAIGLLAAAPYRRPPRALHHAVYVPPTEDLGRFVRDAPRDLGLFAVLAAATGSRNAALRSLADAPAAVDAANGVARFPAASDKRRTERIKPLPKVACDWWRLVAAGGGALAHWRVDGPTFSRRFARWAKKLGTPRLRPHGVKRWLARELVRLGASPWAVKYAMDHAQSDVTGAHYLRPFDELAGLVDRVAFPREFFTPFTEAVRELSHPRDPGARD